jgi:signal transduction histidine kinase
MTRTPRSRDDGPVKRGDTGPSTATWAWVAVVVAVLDSLGEAAAFAVAAATDQHLGITENSSWINVVAGPTFPLLAALVLRSRGRDAERPPRIDRLAWLLLAFGALCTSTVVVHVLADDALQQGLPGARALAWVSTWLWTAVVPLLLLSLLWFPTGERPGPRWRWLERGLVLAYGGMLLSVAFDPGPMPDFPGRGDNPLGWRAGEDVLHVASGIGFSTLSVCFFATVASLLVRFLRGDPGQRAQLRWLVAVLAVIAVTVAIPGDVIPAVSVAVNIGATFLLPVTLAVALTRRDGYGLPRVLVYGFLSVVLMSAYLLIVVVAQGVFGGRADRAASLGAAGAVAVLAAPLRTRLQRATERLVYGDRGDPQVALADLGRRLAGSPDELLDEVVRTVAQALRAPYAAIVLAGEEEPAAVSGSPVAERVVVPLRMGDRGVGDLVVGQRSPLERYSARDMGLVTDLARPIAVAAHAAALTRDLQRSRESLVIAREEERRRIRRDLHDGLGPALAGVAFGLDAARNVLERDPAKAGSALADLKHELQGSIADVRRLVYDLRPPALDQLGLVPALEEYAARLGERGALSVTVQSEPMPPLPAAVEVAAYRIATEALTNAARHSRAGRTDVTLALDGSALRVEVVDDGVGIPPDARRGVGLAAMGERASELGGTCAVSSPAAGGTAVVALLPVRSEA